MSAGYILIFFLLFTIILLVALEPFSSKDPPLVMLGSTKKPGKFTDTKTNTDVIFTRETSKKDSLNLLRKSNAYYDITNDRYVLEVRVNSEAVNSARFLCSLISYAGPKTERIYGMLIFLSLYH